MDDIVLRSRYPRHSVSNRKKKKHAGEKAGLSVIIARQALIALLILLAALAAKYSDAPAAAFIRNQLTSALTQDIDLSGAMEKMNGTLDDMWNKKLTDPTTKQTDKDSSAGGQQQTQDNKTSEIMMMAAPVKGTLSSGFGERDDPVTGVRKMHEGIDIEAAKGENIQSVLAGTVIEVSTSKSYGKYVKIRHKDNLTTVYAHCSLTGVIEGQEVKQGEVIAKVGNTGASLGDHLHFEIWKDGKAVNPLDYVSIDK